MIVETYDSYFEGVCELDVSPATFPHALEHFWGAHWRPWLSLALAGCVATISMPQMGHRHPTSPHVAHHWSSLSASDGVNMCFWLAA